MPIYKLPNGKTYNLPKEKVNSFLQKYPTAILQAVGKPTPVIQGAIAEGNAAPVDLGLSLEKPLSDTLLSLDNQLLDLNISYNYILFGMSILAIASAISLFITMSRIPNLK